MVSHAAEHGAQTQHQGASCSQHSNLIRLPLNAMECVIFYPKNDGEIAEPAKFEAE
jgi:hypothetical protein